MCSVAKVNIYIFNETLFQRDREDVRMCDVHLHFNETLFQRDSEDV